MTIAIEMKPEIEIRVRTLAAEKGISTADFLSTLLESGVFLLIHE